MAGGPQAENLALLFSLGCLLWGAAGSARVVQRVRYHSPLTPADFGLPYEPARFTSADGVSLDAWWIRRPDPTGVLVLLHGFGASKADLLDVAVDFNHSCPFDLLMLDFRAHGASGGETISFGLREVLDVEAALKAAAADPRVGRLPVGCYGVSMGGAIAFLAAARFPAIRAVATDSSYADTAQAIAGAQRLTYHIPRIPLGQMVLWGTEFRLGRPLRETSPVRVIGRISPRPVLLVHGGMDAGIPPGEARRLHAAARDPKELWIVPEAEHAACFYRDRREYVRRVGGFFQNAFLRTP